MIKTNLGLSNVGNNWKLVLANFLLMFGVQAAFKFDEIINTGSYPSGFEIVKIASNSFIVTLIFYGYNKYKEKTA